MPHHTLISIEALRADLKDGRRTTGGVFRVATEAPVPEENSRKIRFCFSDGSVDRMGDTIDPNGWDIRDFNANPVALWAHDSYSPPIGRASNVTVEGARLMGDIEFIGPETYAFSDTIYRMVRGKFLNAVSVGFIPLEYSFVENDPDRGWGIDFKRQQLLEISICPVPANPNALAETYAEARAKGIDTRPLMEWAERMLDGGGKITVPKSTLERLRKAAKDASMAVRPRRRSEDDTVDEPKGKCGRAADDECGMSDPEECSIHAAHKVADPVDPDDEKALIRALRRLTGKLVILRADDGTDDEPTGDEPPLAHEDAIRMAHKCFRTAKAFMTEGMIHHNKAVDLLGDVVDALDKTPDDDGRGGEPNADDPDDTSEKVLLLKRIAERRRTTA